MKTLVIRFNGSPREYHYCYAGKKDAMPGDWAVVHNGSEFAVVIILRQIPGVEPRVTKYALAVITQEDFNNYLEQNRRIEEYRRLEEQLSYRLKLRKRRQDLKDMAEGDPESLALIQKLESFERTTARIVEVEPLPSPTPSEEPDAEVDEPLRPVTREDIETARPPSKDTLP